MAEWPVTFKIRSLIQCRFSPPWLLSPSEPPFQFFWESAGVLKMTSSCVIVCPNSCLKEKTKGNMIQLAHHSVYMMWVIQILGRTFWFKQLFETQQKVEPNPAFSTSTSLWSKNLVSQVELWWSRYNKSPKEFSTSEQDARLDFLFPKQLQHTKSMSGFTVSPLYTQIMLMILEWWDTRSLGRVQYTNGFPSFIPSLHVKCLQLLHQKPSRSSGCDFLGMKDFGGLEGMKTNTKSYTCEICQNTIHAWTCIINIMYHITNEYHLHMSCMYCASSTRQMIMTSLCSCRIAAASFACVASLGVLELWMA